MCGRYSFVASKEKLKKHFPQIKHQPKVEISYNIAPSQKAYVITNNNPNRLSQFYWGLVPYWARDSKNLGKLMNARCEEITSKPSFRMPIRRKRCLVLADSFYEWKTEGRKKVPYRIQLKNNALLAMAGIWDVWNEGGERPLYTFSIITTEPNEEMKNLHNRMPVILNTVEEQKQWLGHIGLEKIRSLMKTLENDQLTFYRISEKLNSPINNDINLHTEVKPPPTLFD